MMFDPKIKHTVLIFGGLSVIILLVLQLKHWSLFTIGTSDELFIVISGISFLIIGMVFSRYFFINKENQRKKTIHSSLTDQELKVLRFIAEGLSNKEIAANLFIAETTVKTHVSNLYAKLGAKRRTDAIRIGQKLEII